MASADFCIFSTALRLWLPFSERFMQTSPGTTRFFPSIYLPHLPPLVPCSFGTSTWMAALSPTIASYAVPVRQARGLPPTSFRFRLATNTLVFGYVFPATGQTPIFHRLETCAAGRTTRNRPARFNPAGRLCSFICTIVFSAPADQRLRPRPSRTSDCLRKSARNNRRPAPHQTPVPASPNRLLEEP